MGWGGVGHWGIVSSDGGVGAGGCSCIASCTKVGVNRLPCGYAVR